MSAAKEEPGDVLAQAYARDLAIWDQEFFGVKPYGKPKPVQPQLLEQYMAQWYRDMVEKHVADHNEWVAEMIRIASEESK